jgi:hypothetical protein
MKNPEYLVPECIATAAGIGPLIDVGADRGKLLVLTLAVTCIVEQESLVVTIWGSPDKIIWGTQPLVSFTQKHYCGMYSILLNLAKYPGVRYVHAEWKMSRWGRELGSPMFAFYVSAEPSGSRLSVKAAASAKPLYRSVDKQDRPAPLPPPSQASSQKRSRRSSAAAGSEFSAVGEKVLVQTGRDRG